MLYLLNIRHCVIFSLCHLLFFCHSSVVPDWPLQKHQLPPKLFSPKAGTDVVVSKPGGRLLHLASHMGHTKCISLLLEHRASPNVVNSAGMSAMHFAAASGELSAVEVLAGHKESAIDMVDLQGN